MQRLLPVEDAHRVNNVQLPVRLASCKQDRFFRQPQQQQSPRPLPSLPLPTAIPSAALYSDERRSAELNARRQEACRYLHGTAGFIKSVEKAEQIFKQLAEKHEDHRSLLELGNIYKVKGDYTIALHYYRRAADANSSMAWFEVRPCTLSLMELFTLFSSLALQPNSALAWKLTKRKHAVIIQPRPILEIAMQFKGANSFERSSPTNDQRLKEPFNNNPVARHNYLQQHHLDPPTEQ